MGLLRGLQGIHDDSVSGSATWYTRPGKVGSSREPGDNGSNGDSMQSLAAPRRVDRFAESNQESRIGRGRLVRDHGKSFLPLFVRLLFWNLPVAAVESSHYFKLLAGGLHASWLPRHSLLQKATPARHIS
ncbi:MAG TPA: hypothetical protein VKB42_11060 [Dongiaceae bacterium]|nr:hypothetical protein [Dongiaceae bacterium]